MSEQPLTPEQIREAIMIYCDATDAATTQLRRNLGGQQFKQAQMPNQIDVSKLAWTRMEAPDNPKGPWEKTTERDNPVYKELETFLTPKSPKPLEGFLYWLSREKDYIGRRALGRKQQ